MADAGDAEIDYTNWRGERQLRRIRPLRFIHGVTEHHREPGWLVWAMCLEKKEFRYFALSGVHAWRELGELPSSSMQG